MIRRKNNKTMRYLAEWGEMFTKRGDYVGYWILFTFVSILSIWALSEILK
jgi:hypothetical protein